MAGFSLEVDKQLKQAANIGKCPKWHLLIILLLDEVYIKENLVYNKHSGKLIGYVDLGNVNNHLLAFERKVRLISVKNYTAVCMLCTMPNRVHKHR